MREISAFAVAFLHSIRESDGRKTIESGCVAQSDEMGHHSTRKASLISSVGGTVLANQLTKFVSDLIRGVRSTYDAQRKHHHQTRKLNFFLSHSMIEYSRIDSWDDTIAIASDPTK